MLLMNRQILIQQIESSGVFSYARSGGPGGQNVNKVNTKVLLTLDPESLDSLTPSQRERVRWKLGSRLNSRGELYVQVQQERSQLLNRQTAVEMLADLILKSLERPRKRNRTRPTKGSVERRLNKKKRLGAKKKSRSRSSWME